MRVILTLYIFIYFILCYYIIAYTERDYCYIVYVCVLDGRVEEWMFILVLRGAPTTGNHRPETGRGVRRLRTDARARAFGNSVLAGLLASASPHQRTGNGREVVDEASLLEEVVTRPFEGADVRAPAGWCVFPRLRRAARAAAAGRHFPTGVKCVDCETPPRPSLKESLNRRIIKIHRLCVRGVRIPPLDAGLTSQVSAGAILPVSR